MMKQVEARCCFMMRKAVDQKSWYKYIIRRNGKAENLPDGLVLTVFLFLAFPYLPDREGRSGFCKKVSSAFSKNSTARLLVDFGYLCLIL